MHRETITKVGAHANNVVMSITFLYAY